MALETVTNMIDHVCNCFPCTSYPFRRNHSGPLLHWSHDHPHEKPTNSQFGVGFSEGDNWEARLLRIYVWTSGLEADFDSRYFVRVSLQKQEQPCKDLSFMVDPDLLSDSDWSLVKHVAEQDFPRTSNSRQTSAAKKNQAYSAEDGSDEEAMDNSDLFFENSRSNDEDIVSKHMQELKKIARGKDCPRVFLWNDARKASKHERKEYQLPLLIPLVDLNSNEAPMALRFWAGMKTVNKSSRGSRSVLFQRLCLELVATDAPELMKLADEAKSLDPYVISIPHPYFLRKDSLDDVSHLTNRLHNPTLHSKELDSNNGAEQDKESQSSFSSSNGTSSTTASVSEVSSTRAPTLLVPFAITPEHWTSKSDNRPVSGRKVQAKDTPLSAAKYAISDISSHTTSQKAQELQATYDAQDNEDAKDSLPPQTLPPGHGLQKRPVIADQFVRARCTTLAIPALQYPKSLELHPLSICFTPSFLGMSHISDPMRRYFAYRQLIGADPGVFDICWFFQPLWWRRSHPQVKLGTKWFTDPGVPVSLLPLLLQHMKDTLRDWTEKDVELYFHSEFSLANTKLQSIKSPYLYTLKDMSSISPRLSGFLSPTASSKSPVTAAFTIPSIRGGSPVSKTELTRSGGPSQGDGETTVTSPIPMRAVVKPSVGSPKGAKSTRTLRKSSRKPQPRKMNSNIYYELASGEESVTEDDAIFTAEEEVSSEIRRKSVFSPSQVQSEASIGSKLVLSPGEYYLDRRGKRRRNAPSNGADFHDMEEDTYSPGGRHSVQSTESFESIEDIEEVDDYDQSDFMSPNTIRSKAYGFLPHNSNRKRVHAQPLKQEQSMSMPPPIFSPFVSLDPQQTPLGATRPTRKVATATKSNVITLQSRAAHRMNNALMNNGGTLSTSQPMKLKQQKRISMVDNAYTAPVDAVPTSAEIQGLDDVTPTLSQVSVNAKALNSPYPVAFDDLTSTPGTQSDLLSFSLEQHGSEQRSRMTQYAASEGTLKSNIREVMYKHTYHLHPGPDSYMDSQFSLSTQDVSKEALSGNRRGSLTGHEAIGLHAIAPGAQSGGWEGDRLTSLSQFSVLDSQQDQGDPRSMTNVPSTEAASALLLSLQSQPTDESFRDCGSEFSQTLAMHASKMRRQDMQGHAEYRAEEQRVNILPRNPGSNVLDTRRGSDSHANISFDLPSSQATNRSFSQISIRDGLYDKRVNYEDSQANINDSFVKILDNAPNAHQSDYFLLQQDHSDSSSEAAVSRPMNAKESTTTSFGTQDRDPFLIPSQTANDMSHSDVFDTTDLPVVPTSISNMLDTSTPRS